MHLAPLAQLDRARPSGGRGQRFESSRARHFDIYPKTAIFALCPICAVPFKSERIRLAGQIGNEILDYIKRMFRLWHRHKHGEISRKTFQAGMKPIRKHIERSLTEGTNCGHEKTEGTCTQILKHKQSRWTFVDIEGIEPTNNFAEQLIRFYVLWRKNSFGTQSERGNLFAERMMTAMTTCKLQNRNR